MGQRLASEPAGQNLPGANTAGHQSGAVIVILPEMTATELRQGMGSLRALMFGLLVEC